MSIASEISRISQNVSDSLDAVAAKGVAVPSGSTSDDLPGLIAQIASGSGSAISIVDTEDSHGGIIRTITGVSLAGDTVSPSTLLAGYTAHNSLGEAITGTASGGGQPNLQAKTHIAPTESNQTITPDTGYDGLSSVQIDAVSSTYVGSGIARCDESNVTVEGRTVYVEPGYYAEMESKSVALGEVSAPTAEKGDVSNHAISITPSVNFTTGYIVSGTKNGTAVTVAASELVSGTLSITSSGTKDVTNYASASVASGSVTAPSSISGSAATVSTGTNTLTLTKTVSVTPNVTTAGYISSGTAGNSSVSLTASVTTKAAATITPTKSSQTIASGTYLAGTQTIAAIPAAYQDVTQVDAAAGDVASGKKIVAADGTVVTGTLAFQTIYSGSSAPSSSTGVNGDIYIQTA